MSGFAYFASRSTRFQFAILTIRRHTHTTVGVTQVSLSSTINVRCHLHLSLLYAYRSSSERFQSHLPCSTSKRGGIKNQRKLKKSQIVTENKEEQKLWPNTRHWN